MIHLSIGEINRNTKTGCKVKCEDLPRKDGTVEYRNKRLVDCPECLKAVKRLDNLGNK